MTRLELAERLKSAREAAGLSLVEAANRLGFASYQTLSNIEKGDREVKASELAVFAKTYFCNMSNLLMGSDSPQNLVHFLWRKGPPAEKKNEVEASIKHRVEEYRLLETLLGVDQEGMGINISASQADIRSHYQIDALASRIRKSLDLGARPALALKQVMEQILKIKILFVELSEFGSAASTSRPELGEAIVVNNEEAPWRINFTLAHELFHIITWNTCNPVELEQSETLFDDIEKKAERFASTLLLPAEEVRGEMNLRVKDHKLFFSDVVDLAREFGVSTSALLYRMANMHLIKWDKANDLVKNDELLMIDRRIRSSVDCEYPTSERFALLAVKCLRKGLISRGKFADLLDIDRSDIDEFLERRGLREVEGESIEIMASGC